MKSASANVNFSGVILHCSSSLQARTKCLQHSKCSLVRIPLSAIREKYTTQFLNWSAVKDEKDVDILCGISPISDGTLQLSTLS